MKIQWQFLKNTIWQKNMELMKKIIGFEEKIPKKDSFLLLYRNLLTTIEENGGGIAAFSEISRSATRSDSMEKFQRTKLLEVEMSILRAANILKMMENMEVITPEEWEDMSGQCRDIFTGLEQLGYVLSVTPPKK